MNLRVAIGLMLCSAPAFSAEAIDPDTQSGVQVFLEVYQTLSQGHSALFYELYGDNAHIVTQVPGRPPMLFHGVSYKSWGKELISQSQAFPDASRFESATIERQVNRLQVRAHRYSVSRCYLDPHYSLTLEPFGTGYRIIEEHVMLQPTARCDAQDPVALSSVAANRPAAAQSRAVWHPMSAEQINATALRLAQQMPRQAEPSNVQRGAPPPAKPVAPARSDLWVSPPELP